MYPMYLLRLATGCRSEADVGLHALGERWDGIS